MRTSFVLALVASLAMAASAMPGCMDKCSMDMLFEGKDSCTMADEILASHCMSHCDDATLASYGAMYAEYNCGMTEAEFLVVAKEGGSAPAPGPSQEMPVCMETCDTSALYANEDPTKTCGLANEMIATGCISCTGDDLHVFGALYVAYECGTEAEFEALVEEAAAHVSVTTTVVESALTMDGYTVDSFDSTAQTQFEEGVADALGVEASAVKVTDVAASARRRHLLAGITVKFTVTVKGSASSVAAATTSITAKLDSSEAASLTTSLQNAGLSSVSVTGVAAPTTKTTTSGSSVYSSLFAIVASVLVLSATF